MRKATAATCWRPRDLGERDREHALDIEAKKNVSIDDIFDFSLVREVLTEVGETPNL